MKTPSSVRFTCLLHTISKFPNLESDELNNKQTKPINRRQNQPSNQNDGTIRVKDAVGAAGDIAKNLVGKVGDIKLSTPEGRKRRQERKDLRKKQKIERKQARVDQLKNSPAQKKCYK